MATSDDIKATIDNYRAHFSADRAAWLALFAEDATVEDPIGSDIRTGHEQIGDLWDFAHSLSPSIELRAAGPTCVAGNEAAFPFTIVNDFDGTRMAIDVIDVMTFTDDAKIATMRAFWDMAAMRELEP